MKILKPDRKKSTKIPLYNSNIKAGFPSPADDFIDLSLDLNEHLIDHPEATFFVKVSGDSMINAGIHQDDLLIVDRSFIAENDQIVIAILNGEFTCKRYHKDSKGNITLLPENENYKPIKITESMDFMVWGVVTYVIHKTN